MEFIKKLVLACDPDFKKLTPLEHEELEKALEDTETISHNEVNYHRPLQSVVVH